MKQKTVRVIVDMIVWLYSFDLLVVYSICYAQNALWNEMQIVTALTEEIMFNMRVNHHLNLRTYNTPQYFLSLHMRSFHVEIEIRKSCTYMYTRQLQPFHQKYFHFWFIGAGPAASTIREKIIQFLSA